MAWLFGILAVIAFLILLFAFPKQTLGCVAALITALVIGWLVFIDAPNRERKRDEAGVQLSVAYTAGDCQPINPLKITVRNGSRKKVRAVSCNLDVFRPGYSTDLSGYDDRINWDRILAPGESFVLCYGLPSSLQATEDPALLEYRLSAIYVSFSD